jgi:hypothetical protein
MQAAKSKRRQRLPARLPTHEEEPGNQSATESEKSIQAAKSNKKSRLKAGLKAPPAQGRTTKKCTRKQIDRFQPSSFAQPKQCPTKRVKEVYYMPNLFTLAVGKMFCGEDSKEAANCLNSKVSDMGDRPLAFLGDPELNENKWDNWLRLWSRPKRSKIST